MEGAGSSFLSPAAELATRGIDYADEEMDSADEETELPSAVQDLIRRLGEKNSDYWIRDEPILSGPEVKKFFPPLSTNTGWRSQVRLRVLEAIGSSASSSKFLLVGNICGSNISRLTASEWEVVLRGFRSSSVLEEMRIWGLEWSSEADLESLGLQLGIILNTSSVAKLEIHDQIESMWNRTQRSGYLYQSGLTERFFLNLASGLRENSHSKLTSLVLHDSWGNAVKFIIEVLTGHHQLETLILDITWGGDEATVRLLSQALKQNSSLKQLALWQVKDGCAALLLNALAGDDGNRSIEQLELKGMSGIGKCLAEVFISNRSLRVVTLDWIFMDVEEWRLLGEAIRDNATATTVSVQFSNFKFTSHVNFLASYTHVNYVLEEFSWAASSEGKEPVLHLELYDSERDSLSYVSRTSQLSKLKFLGSVLRGEIKSVHSLSLPLHGIYLSRGMSIEDILPINRITGETSSLKRLQLHGIYYVMWLWKHLVQCLRWNTSVNSLSLCFSLKKKEFKHGAFKDGGELKEEFEDGEFKDGGGLEEEFEDGEFEEVFRDLMALLQANLTLQEIDVSKTPWARDGKAALIEAALKQNQERAEYMSVFTEAKLQLGDAKAGRLFLCGSPRAGKTQLRRTLMKIIQDKSWFGERCEELSRTIGIEVEFLQNDDKMQISIWDLAGQSIFRTLQNVLFPKTNEFCVFLFVYSPFCEENSFPKPDICFQTELEGWLTFIASSTKVMGHNLPQVLVVISHKDKIESTSLTWANSIVEVLRKRFKNYVDLRPIQDFLYVNTREKNQVIPLKEHIFFIFQELLSQKSPLVPQLCFKLSSLLLSNIEKNKTCSLWSLEKFHDFCFILSSLLFSNIENKTCPLWSLEKFHEFCYPSLKELNLPSSVDHLRLSKSLLSYLNDVGSIIYIPNFDHIVVDPNWLTNSVLGELIAMGQHFKAQESNAYEKIMSSDSYTSKDGFVSESVFTRLIETFLEKQPRLQNVDREVIEKILFNLDLGFKLENSFQYFIPSFIMEEQKQQEGVRVVSMSWESKAANPNFVGIRIQCKDQKTMSLSAAFFPRYQMFMRRKLISEMSVPMETMTFSRYYLKLFLDGHEIYVEHVQSEESHYYVDVLMLCSEHKSKETAIKYVLYNIVKELISFCATPNGCPS
ncbi:hypothetical protein MPTK1_6g04930 [Marchantia polymorpha subsp. ruderalis]